MMDHKEAAVWRVIDPNDLPTNETSQLARGPLQWVPVTESRPSLVGWRPSLPGGWKPSLSCLLNTIS